MATHITGNQDGPNRENQTYTIVGRGIVTRELLVEEVKAGKHKNHSIYTLNGVGYVRAKPNLSEDDNVNKD